MARSFHAPTALLLGVLVSTLAAPVLAQSSDRRAAVEAFRAGEAAATEERWGDALEHFRTAYDLTALPTALYNVAFALRALGRYLEARDAYDELLTLEVPSELLDSALEYRAEVAGRIASLSLTDLSTERHDVRVGGAARQDTLLRPLLVEADPGPTLLEVRREGFTPFEWSGTLGEGDHVDLSVILAPLPSGGGIEREPWLWIVVGVVVVGAAVALGVVLDDQAQLRAPADRTLVRL